MDKKNSSRFVLVFMGSLVLISLVLGWILGKNYSKDTSKERTRLTKLLKEIEEKNFSYNPERGAKVYNQFCLRCHGPQGEGTAAAPPLSNSDFVVGNKERLVKIVTHGMKGKIERNGKVFDLAMPAFPMITHEDLAHLLSYIRSSFGNQASTINTKEVLKTKIEHVERLKPWNVKDL